MHATSPPRRMIGNLAMQRLLKVNIEAMEAGSKTVSSTRFGHEYNPLALHAKARVGIQSKPAVGAPGDMYEKEADRVADQVMRMPEPDHMTTNTREEGCPNCPAKQAQKNFRSILPASRILPLTQRQPNEEEIETQMKSAAETAPPPLQRQPCEQEVQPKMKAAGETVTIQRLPCEEEMQPKMKTADEAAPIQKQPYEEEVQPKMDQAGETPFTQRQAVEEDQIVQTKPADEANTGQTSISESQLHAGENSGQPLSDSSRRYFEPRFGHDFNNVRIHTRDNAVRMSQSLNARAFTHGSHIYFNRGQYNPETYSGKHLLSHELTHVLQQTGNRGRRISRNPSPGCSTWGGFRICGSAAFRRTVASELTTLNGTSQGSGALSAIAAHRAPWYRSLIRINERGYCGFLPVAIYYDASGCSVTHSCPGTGSAWQRVPNHVYLFHEIAHVYEYLIGGRGTHRDRECMVTGLGSYFTTIPYNENRLRCELGLPVRPCYNGYCTAHPPPTC